MSASRLDTACYNMIEQQVRPWGVSDPRVLHVFQQVRREQFVPEIYRSLAYSDYEIPIGNEQAMLAPKVEGRILQALAITPTDRILEIGTGSGFLTACLAKLGQNVVTVDCFADFTENARSQLEKLALKNVIFRTGNAAVGWDQDGPFDAITVSGSLPRLHRHFHTLLRQGGRLFVITGEGPVMEARVFTRVDDYQFQEQSLFETWLKPMENLTSPAEFEF